MLERQGPELVIGLVGAVGCPLSAAVTTIEESLSRFDYTTTEIRMSSFLALVPEASLIDSSTEAERLKSSMRAGTELRKRVKRGDVLLAFAAARMASERRNHMGTRDTKPDAPPLPMANHAFILKSLKHPDEVHRLRQIYRDQFILLGVYSPRARRVRELAEQLAHSAASRTELFREQAESLILVDENELGTKLGQSVRESFPLADAFVSSDRLRHDVDRVFDLLFGMPVATPTKDEQGMFFAQAAALRSGALARQVGACVTTRDGDVLAVGCNEVPRAGGGQYWAGDDPDGRDFAAGYDRNDRLKQRVVREVIGQLLGSDWINPSLKDCDLDELVKAAMKKEQADPPGKGPGNQNLARLKPPRLRDALIGNLTEFGRDVHAEMSAMMTLSRLPISSIGCTLFCTTFPCHNCAKHIIAAGIARVVYIEPYPKSFASDFHPDAISVEGSEIEAGWSRVAFQPFAGVAPRKYLTWFKSGRRKTEDGLVHRWLPREALPVFASPELGGYDQADLGLEANLVQEVLAAAIDSTDSHPKEQA